MTNINWENFDEVGGVNADRVWFDKENPLEVGQTIEGRLVSKEPKKDDFNSSYLIEVDGEVVKVYGSTVLDTKLGNVAIGKIVAIQYLGEIPSKIRGRKPYKDFKVGVGKDYVGDE